MSSADSRPPNAIGQSSEPAREQAPKGSAASAPAQSNPQSTPQGKAQSKSQSLRKPPTRPQLMGPPTRPKPPAPAPVATTPPPPPPAPEPEKPQVIGPISQPSERMQYRAIGMLKGKYVASEEQFNRGNIAIADGTLVDAVLLGRVTSLIKKHIDLDLEHVWVVYPRTLYNDDNVPALHVQIVGVWEPETLNAGGEASTETSSSDESAEQGPRYLSTEEAAKQCDVFSIRGEVAKYSEEKNEIVINIVQKSKSETVKPKRPFKLLISGQISGRTTGYFWDLTVERKEGKLILLEGAPVAVVPPKKKPKNARKDGGKRKRPGKPRPSGSVPKPKPKSKSDAKPKDTVAAKDNDKGNDKVSAEPVNALAAQADVIHDGAPKDDAKVASEGDKTEATSGAKRQPADAQSADETSSAPESSESSVEVSSADADAVETEISAT